MRINIANPVFQTNLFIMFFALAVLLTLRKDAKPFEMNHQHTDELKGVAILMVVFSHIGYFLANDTRFLFPLSIAAGVGVNIFLFLSGFGLTSSELKVKKTWKEFYMKRSKTIYLPMWIAFAAVLALDYSLLGKTYELPVVIKSFLGYFPVADIYTSINSALWYFTFILFYYLAFPIVFRRNQPLFSAFIMLVLAYLVTRLALPVTKDLLKLYQTHIFLFPLGMAFAWINTKDPGIRFQEVLLKFFHNSLVTGFVRYLVVAGLLFAFGYTAVHSGVGKGVMTEQLSSIVTMLALIAAFLLKNVHSELLVIFGKYSYEIYLLHWPVMYRHDFIYKYLPASMGTLLYLVIFVAVGFALNKFVHKLLK